MVWDEAVGHEFEMREHSIDFGETIGTTAEVFHNYEGAKILRAAFPVGTFLNLIKNENQVSGVKVVVMDDMLMAFFEVCDGSETCMDDMLLNRGKLFLTTLKLHGAVLNKLGI